MSGEQAVLVRAARALFEQLLAARWEASRERADEVSGEFVSEVELRELERHELAARRDWLAMAPTGPTSWWPGGWRVVVGGLPHRRGGVANLGVWRTAQEAASYVHRRAATAGVWRNARVQWCAVREDFPVLLNNVHADVVALDDAFWERHATRAEA